MYCGYESERLITKIFTYTHITSLINYLVILCSKVLEETVLLNFSFSYNLMQKRSIRSMFSPLTDTKFRVSASDICPNLLYLASLILYQCSVKDLLCTE